MWHIKYRALGEKRERGERGERGYRSISVPRERGKRQQRERGGGKPFSFPHTTNTKAPLLPSRFRRIAHVGRKENCCTSGTQPGPRDGHGWRERVGFGSEPCLDPKLKTKLKPCFKKHDSGLRSSGLFKVGLKQRLGASLPRPEEEEGTLMPPASVPSFVCQQ